MRKWFYSNDFLSGGCQEYASALKNFDSSLTIMAAISPLNNGLIHAYCMDQDGNFIDCRGIFSKNEEEEFFSNFCFWNEQEKRFHERVRILSFNSVESFGEYLTRELFPNGCSHYDEDTDQYYRIPFLFHGGERIKLNF